MKTEKIGAIILAAGYSSRMGELKQILPLGDSITVERSVKCFRKAGIKNINVVVGYQAHEILRFLQELEVDFCINENYDKGMFSSIQTGLSNLPNNLSAFFVLPCDCPLIETDTVYKLLKTYQARKPMIVYPCHEKKRGHPPLISTKLTKEILESTQPGGLYPILTNYDDVALDVEVGNLGILLDMDTPKDYEIIRGKLSRQDSPTVQKCMEILDRHNVKASIIEHSRKVAMLACFLAFKLNQKGYNLDLELVTATGLLHDIAKGKPNHAVTGAMMVCRLGYPKVGEVISQHSDIKVSKNTINEAEILYLADKLIIEDKIVSIDERFQRGLDKYGSNAEAKQNIIIRRKNAKIIKEKIENIVGGI